MTKNNFQVLMTQKVKQVLSTLFRDASNLDIERRELEEEINTMRPELDKLLELIHTYKSLKEDVIKHRD